MVYFSGESARLSITQNAIFDLLWEAYPDPVPSEDLQYGVWRGADVDGKNNLAQQMYLLRGKLLPLGITVKNAYSGQWAGARTGGYWLAW